MTSDALRFDDPRELRCAAVDRLRERARFVALLPLGPILAAFGVYVAVTTGSGWHRVVALSMVALTGAVHAIPRVPLRVAGAARCLLGVTLIVLSGGLHSPMLMFLALPACFVPLLAPRRHALAFLAFALAFVWTLAALHLRHGRVGPADALAADDPVRLLACAGCATALLLGGHVLGAWARAVDDEMLRQAFAAREEALRTHFERLHEMTMLSGEIAHALNNPLASVKGLAALMELEPGRAAERLRVLRGEVDRMQSVLEGFLSFSCPSTPLEVGAVDLGALAVSVAQLHEGIARVRGLSLDTAGAGSIVADCDARKVRQLLISLVQNAIEAGAAGTAVELATRPEGDRCAVVVQDRGPGLDPDELSRVWLPGVTSRQARPGLGLTLVRAIAEQHRGSARIENRPGGGLRATVLLPRHASGAS